jgi:hypothetical protein
MFISTTSVYRDQSEIGINENSPTVPMPAGLDPYQPDQRNSAQLAASSNPANYGAFKARAEVEVQNQYPGSTRSSDRVSSSGRSIAPTVSRTGRRASTRAGKCSRLTSRRSVSVHRLTRSRRVDDSHGGNERIRNVQCDRSREAAHDQRDVVRCQSDHHRRRTVHVGAVGLFGGAGYPTVDTDDGLAAAVRAHGGATSGAARRKHSRKDSPSARSPSLRKTRSTGTRPVRPKSKPGRSKGRSTDFR